MADEVSCHNVEYLLLCLRFIDYANNIREEFISFAKIERVRAADIGNAIMQCLEGLSLPINRLHGQGYDRASTMRGDRAGVHILFKEKPYTLTVQATLSI